MNVQQFAKLKAGDQFRNGISGSVGEVVDADRSGVRVRWLAVGSDKNNTPTWHYSVQSTAWFHWNLIEGSEDDVSQPGTSSTTDAPQA